MGRKRALAAALFAITALLLGQSAFVAADVVDIGGSVSETVMLASGQWRAYDMTLGFLDSLRIAVDVTQGGPIDVFSTNVFGFGQYTSPNATEFSYYPDGSQLNTSSFVGSLTPPTSGQYYLILDNTAITNPGARPSGPVTVHVTLGKASLLPVVVGIFVAIAATVVAAFWLLWWRRRKRQAAPPVPPSE